MASQSKIEKQMRDKIFRDMEERLIPAAKALFKLLGEHSDTLVMGEEFNIDKDKVVKTNVAIVDKFGEEMKKLGIRSKEVNMIFQYMQGPISDIQWRVEASVGSFKDAILEMVVGKPIQEMDVNDLMNATQRLAEESKAKEKSTAEVDPSQNA